MAYQVILEPGVGQFRALESPRVHTRTNSWGLFLVHKLTCEKRELATLDKKATSSGIAEPYCAIKTEGKNRGEEGTTPCDHDLSRSWKVEVCKKKRKKKGGV